MMEDASPGRLGTCFSPQVKGEAVLPRMGARQPGAMGWLEVGGVEKSREVSKNWGSRILAYRS